jgi:four helix bundle protein
MSVVPKIVLTHGGYRNLIVYRKSEVIYQGTVVFCRRFLPQYGDRTVDQMIQAARSCKQNIAEGSAASGTSKETEIKLTNVARATLDELFEDYLDYLKSHGADEWANDDKRKIAALFLAPSPYPLTPIQLYYSRPCATNMALVKDNITRINSRKKFRHITAKWITEFEF